MSRRRAIDAALKRADECLEEYGRTHKAVHLAKAKDAVQIAYAIARAIEKWPARKRSGWRDVA